MNTTNPSQAFIIRVWCEPREEGDLEPVIRGNIEHLETKDSRYFSECNQLAEFITKHLSDEGSSRKNKSFDA
jgi:hypothetical protein